MTNTKKQTTSEKTFRLAGLAILTALIIVLQVVTTYFPTKPFAVTLALMPIVVGSALYGKWAGAYLGAVFSVVVIIMCAIGGDVGGQMVFNANPFLCIVLCMLKGSAAGFVAGLLYSLLEKKNTIVATVVAAAAAPVVNTGIFILGLLAFFRPTLQAWAGETDILVYAISFMVSINFLVELIVNVIMSPVIVRIIQIIKKQK